MRQTWIKARDWIDHALGLDTEYVRLNTGEIRRRLPKLRGKAARKQIRELRSAGRLVDKIRQERQAIRRLKAGLANLEEGDR